MSRIEKVSERVGKLKKMQERGGGDIDVVFASVKPLNVRC